MNRSQVAGRRVALIGLGRSHLALARVFCGLGATVVGFDRRSQLNPEEVSELSRLGVQLHLGEDYLSHLVGFDALFLTPGMRKDFEPIEKAKAEGTEISGEAAFFLENAPARVIGISGSAGKTTTSTLVHAMLRSAAVPAYLAGNIGRPLVELLDEIGPGDTVVAELSSFQLQLCTVSPQIAAILNVTPNHLDIHASMDEYREAKLNMVRFQRQSDDVVLPLDDAGLRQRVAACSPARQACFAAGPAPAAAAFVADGDLIVDLDGTRQRICAREEILLPGEHNVLNVLAASLLACLAGARPDAIAAVVQSFRGVPHRLELVLEHGGVRYINDSIATAPERAMAALAATSAPVLWIAGGYDKQLDYRSLLAHVKKVRQAFLIGATAEKIAAVLREAQVPYRILPDLEAAVTAARATARPGDTVLLSPASASYDQFPNFEARGEAFRRFVREGV